MIHFFNRKAREKEFERMFVAMYPNLVRHACQLLGDMDEAKDAVSGVMQKAWEQYGKKGDEVTSAWLYTATRNAVLNRLKHLKVETEHIEAVARATQADTDDDYRHHEQLLQTAERIAGELGEPTRTILRRCYWERKTYAEVADEMGISPNTVKKNISKALAALRTAMRGHTQSTC